MSASVDLFSNNFSMDWMSGALDRFYSTSTDDQTVDTQVKEESLYSNLDLSGCGTGGTDSGTSAEVYPSIEMSLLDGEVPVDCDTGGGTAEVLLSARPVKECGVCGDKALGYNFNAITCESCKAFFRRNALKTKDFRCPFNDTCSIDMVTRRFCQKCRLKKCYSIGMKKEWIMTDDEKRLKRRKAAENRGRRSGSDTSHLDTSPQDYSAGDAPYWTPHSPVSPYPAPQPSPSMTAGFPFPETEDSPLPKRPKEEPVFPACYTPASAAASPCRDAGVQASAADTPLLHDSSAFSLDSVLRMAVKAEFARLGEPVVPAGQLNPAERAKIHQLLDAQQALIAPLSEDNLYVNLVNTDPSLVNVINLCDIAIRRLVQMSKRMQSFRGLCQRDQIALLKGGCTELMILRSVTTYDAENNSWNIKASDTDFTSIKLNVLQKAPHDVYDRHRQFNLSFHQRWKTDPYIMGLLSAITLFTADRPNLQHRDAVALEQESYYYLLRRYLQTSMSVCEANTEFLQLINKLQELRKLNEQHVKLFLDVDPHDVKPLLIEIFDLKCGRTSSQQFCPQDIDSLLPFL